jgi:hypothetical protein
LAPWPRHLAFHKLRFARLHQFFPAMRNEARRRSSQGVCGAFPLDVKTDANDRKIVRFGATSSVSERPPWGGLHASRAHSVGELALLTDQTKLCAWHFWNASASGVAPRTAAANVLLDGEQLGDMLQHSRMSVLGTFGTCRLTLTMSVQRGIPEVANPPAKRRF